MELAHKLCECAVRVVKHFLRHAVVGGNAASPGCAVHDAGEALAPGSGIFMLALQAELRRRGIEVPFQAMRDASPDLLDEDIAHFRQLLLAANLGERAG